MIVGVALFRFNNIGFSFHNLKLSPAMSTKSIIHQVFLNSKPPVGGLVGKKVVLQGRELSYPESEFFDQPCFTARPSRSTCFALLPQVDPVRRVPHDIRQVSGIQVPRFQLVKGFCEYPRELGLLFQDHGPISGFGRSATLRAPD